MKNFRAGIIGCGWISAAHVNGHRATGRVEVAAAADVSPERLATFGSHWGVTNLYQDYREMLAREKLDLVSICTPARLHPAMVKEVAAHAPKAVICEKPLALSLGECDAMLTACRQAACHLLVCHQRRFEARYVKAKEIIRAGTIGEPTFLRTWSGDIFEDGVHVLDLMRFLVDDAAISRIAGLVEYAEDEERLCYGHRSELASLAHLEFATGACGLLCTTGLKCGSFSYAFSILGTEGILEISGENYPAPSWVRVKGRGCGEWQQLEIPNRLLGVPEESLLAQGHIAYFWLDCWQGLMESALHTVETGEDGPCNGDSARADIEALVAICASSRLRKVVELPVQVMDSPVTIGGADRAPNSIWKLA